MSADVVFSCDFDPETINSLRDLRVLRRGVLVSQMEEIESTLIHLVDDGSIKSSEKGLYRSQVLGEISHRLEQLEERMKDPSTFYSDEIEMYLDLLAEPNS
ncbi:MAG: hypothetical protein HRU19_07825 [Pseudobacteriovorax sp.]|nr:hypothetical protein [Pseudobacteriovorax sp.]